jgi:16S rRNA (guanosine(1370)-2'-O)-methyltransferase
MMRAKKDSKFEARLLALEGRRLIEDALDAGLRGHSVYFSEKDTVRGIQLPEKSTTKFFKIPYKNLKLWSTVTTCPGITGIILALRNFFV